MHRILARSMPIAAAMLALVHQIYAQCEPVLVAQLPTTNALDIEIRGSLLYLADGEAGLKIIDIGNPAEPRIIGSLDTYFAVDVAFNGPKVILADERQGVAFVNCEDPTEPVEVARLDFDGWTYAVHAIGDEVYIGSGRELHLYDIDELAAPAPLGSTDCWTVDHLDAEDGIAVVVGDGMRVLDVSDEHAPHVVADVPLTVPNWAVDYQDRIAYTANWRDGMTIFDLVDPSDPEVLSVTPTSDTHPFFEVVVTDGIAYIGSDGLRLYDVSDPRETRLLGASGFWPFIGGLAVQGHLVYATARDQGLLVFDVSACLPCPADLDGDGELTIFDFLAFQNLFDAADPIADFDGDGSLTIFDFLAFQNAFDAGCS